MIQIKNLVKIYNKGKTNEFCALKGIDLSIEEGEMVAIIGKSGAGKSTLLHILAAIDSYDKGSYLVDGVSVGDLKEKDRARFRNQKIGIVMQDYALIDEYTIEENVQIPLIFGKVKGNDVRREKIMTALKNVGLDELAKKPVRQLSGGQKQRLSIARAIAKHPDVYIFDDSFSALDYKTDTVLRSALKEKTTDSVVLIVAQRISTILHAEQIIVLDDGKIVGKGTHEELLKTCDAYYQIAASQLSESELKEAMKEED